MLLYTLLLLWNTNLILSMDDATIDLLTPLTQKGEACGYLSCPIIKENKINVHIVPHSHLELGYTKTFYSHYTGYDVFYEKSIINVKAILDRVLGELWADENRKFTISDSEMPYFFHWWANRDGTVRRMIYTLLRQGRLFFVGGGWGMMDEATTSYHAIIDSYTYALRKINATFLECGRPLVSFQSDVFGHSREFASLIAQMGFDGLFINPISFEDELARMRRKAMEFIWRGSDDLGAETDIYTHKLFDGYWSPPGFCFGGLCEDPLFITSDTVFTNVHDRVADFLEAVKSRQAPHYSTHHIMVMMGMRLGYYDGDVWFANIDTLINKVNEKSYESGAKVHLYYSTPACYLKAVHAASPLLEPKQDDFYPFSYDKYTYGAGIYTSRPTIKYFAREAHVFLQMAKQMQVLARLGNNDKWFEEFMWITGVINDHNIITGAMKTDVKQYYTQKLYVAVQRSTLILKQAFNKIRKTPKTTIYYRCSFNVSFCPMTNRVKSVILVYNPLGWPVTVPIRLPVVRQEYHVYNHKGEEINSAIMKIPEPVRYLRSSTADHELVFIAENIPPLGFRSFYSEDTRKSRPRRSIIKKINNKSKKYYIRQADRPAESNQEDRMFVNQIPRDYEYFDETTTLKYDTKILFGNVSRNDESYDSKDVLTPPSLEIAPVENVVEFNYFNDSETTEPTTHRLDKYTTDIETEKSTVSEDENATENVEATESSTIADKTEYKKTKETRKCFRYVQSNDLFIGNKYIRVTLNNSTRKVDGIYLSNGVNITLDIQFYYYTSDDPLKLGIKNKILPGAYVFRPMDPTPIPIIDFIDTKVYKSDIVQEIHCEYADYASFTVKLYIDSPVVEIDWVIGPVPIDDDIGKEVFIRYMTDLDNKGVFYTDANGRQMMKRIRDVRATFEIVNDDKIAGNFYPVTSKIYIEDLKKNTRLSIFNDRAQGGASLYDGEIDLMVHRRILTDDDGQRIILNETENGLGIIVKGKHYLYLTKGGKTNRIFEKKFAKEIELGPKVLVSAINMNNDVKKEWLGNTNEFTALKNKLPLGVHLLTIEKWNGDTILIRLENYLEKSDVFKTGIRTVDIKNLFVNIKVLNVKETTLSAHIWIEDWVPLQWNRNESFVKNFNEFYGSNVVEFDEDNQIKPVALDWTKGIRLSPQQIRTFVVWYEYVTD